MTKDVENKMFDDLALINHRAIDILNEKGYYFELTKDSKIRGSNYNYENSEKLESLSIIENNCRVYPLKIKIQPISIDVDFMEGLEVRKIKI